MKRVGPHVHTTGGIQNAPLNAQALGAAAFGLFTKNQRRWIAKPLDSITINAFRKNLEDAGYLPNNCLAHDSYLINIGHPDKSVRIQSLDALIDELNRCSQLGLPYLNIHPGSHVNLSTEEDCLGYIAESINSALDKTSGVTIVLENTAGQGSNIGYKFEHLGRIIELVNDKSRIGVCLDTCHLFASGYDLLTDDAYGATMTEFERVVGFRYLRGAHLNDSKSTLGSRVDRHHSLGKGLLGIEPFRKIMNDPRFEEMPLILETIDDTLWKEEIALLYSMSNPDNEP
jgi:deoxyribonuclease IV